MKSIYHANALFNGYEILTDQYLTVENESITGISSQCQDANVVHLNGLLCPGFVDVQVNGGGGELFNNTPTVDTLRCMAEAHLQYGTTGMLPTVITEQYSVMRSAAEAVSKAISLNLPGICGIHFEGPHLSVPKRGIHPERHIRPISDQELALFCNKDMGQVLVTVAPEVIKTDVIKDLVSSGVRICLGHSNANAETVLKALEAGATGFTHLFNAMSPLTSREPGMVGAALADADSYCGLIVDLLHVHPTACKLAVKAKSANNVMLVTDAMSHVGSDQVMLDYCDTQIVRQGDKLTVPDGTLAGSALDMASAVRNCHKILGIPLSDSLKMATRTPSAFLSLDNSIGTLTPGSQANFVLLNDDLEVQKCWINGKQAYCV